MSQLIQNFWKWLFEAVFVLALVLISFITLLAVLNLFFPSGQSLFQLVHGSGEGSSSALTATHQERRVMVGVGSREKDLGELSSMTATLSRMTNNVKSRRSAEIAWSGATPGMTLFDRDAVQTGKRSTARLTFGRSHYLDMGENSLMVIRNLERDVFLNADRTVAVLIEGQFSGEVGKPGEGSLNVDLVTAGATARFPAPEDGGQPASFKMIVNKDESSILTLYQGKADLLFQDQTVEVGTNQIVKVQPGKQPVFLPPPPTPPEPVLPEDGEMFPFRDVPPKVSFIWKGTKNTLRYRFILARDKQFEDVVYEQVTSHPGFSHGNLKPGEYYWRVSPIGAEEEGGFSRTRHLVMVQDLEIPSLEVRLPEGPFGKGDLLLKGATEPEAELFVNGMPVAVDEFGGFEHRIQLKSGWNVLVLEAVDHVGNVAYFSSTLNAQQ
jgi:hypothetical protein